jgi:hypothetical protein
MPPASQFVVAAALFSTQVTVKCLGTDPQLFDHAPAPPLLSWENRPFLGGEPVVIGGRQPGIGYFCVRGLRSCRG